MNATAAQTETTENLLAEAGLVMGMLVRNRSSKITQRVEGALRNQRDGSVTVVLVRVDGVTNGNLGYRVHSAVGGLRRV